jgi:hypothetical protein
MHALQHWKPQSISFLDLPAEIRNQIYRLLIHDPDNRNLKYQRFPPKSVPLPPALFIQTCKQVQQELLPLYLRTIDTHFQIRGQQNRISSSEILPLSSSQILEWLDEHDPDCTDYFHTMTLETEDCNFFCRILVLNPKVVFVELFSFVRLVSRTVLTHVSIALRNQINDSLKTSPTGLLGFKHFAIAKREISLLLQWYEWKRQEFEWQGTKIKATLGGAYRHPANCRRHGCYECFLITQAEMEGLPRVIPAVSFEGPEHIQQRLLWNRDQAIWHRRKAMEAGRSFSEKLMWSYEDYLTEEAERESMPRMIRAATSPLDELKMYE